MALPTPYGLYLLVTNSGYRDVFLSDIQTNFGNGFADRKAGPVYLHPGDVVTLMLTDDVARSYALGTLRVFTDQGLITTQLLAGLGVNLADGVPDFVGATATEDGLAGLVPAPFAGEQEYVLFGDGQWGPPPSAPPVFLGATALTNGAEGQVPGPVAGDQDAFLKGDGTWALPPGSAPFTGATPILSGTLGLVPIPVAGQQAHLLRGDGAWSAPPAIPVPFTGATPVLPGAEGLVPAPGAGDQSAVLTGDGQWTLLNPPPQNGAVVDPSGDDATADGSAARPFATLAAALAWANSQPLGPVLFLLVQPGDYTAEGPLVITRPGISIHGHNSEPEERGLTVVPPLAIGLTSDTGSAFSNQVVLKGLELTGEPSTPPLTVTGAIDRTVVLNSCLIMSAPGSAVPTLLIEAGPGASTTLSARNTNLDGADSDPGAPFLLAAEGGVNADWIDCRWLGADAPALLTLAGAGHTFTFEGCLLDTSGPALAVADDNAALSFSRSVLSSNGANADGVVLSGTASCQMLFCEVHILGSATGRVVRGGAANLFRHGSNLYSDNSSYSAALTATALNPTPSPQA